MRDGVGRHVELHVPGRNEISQAPADWPVTLQKGSLNVRISPKGYPSILRELGLPERVQSLDKRPFAPTFEIAQHEFGNNQLRAEPTMPNKGSAQVWRATLTVGAHNHRCWVLRRYGSGVGEQLELLSDVHLRTTYKLTNGQQAAVTLERGSA